MLLVNFCCKCLYNIIISYKKAAYSLSLYITARKIMSPNLFYLGGEGSRHLTSQVKLSISRLIENRLFNKNRRGHRWGFAPHSLYNAIPILPLCYFIKR
jgi:hypothetical protein